MVLINEIQATQDVHAIHRMRMTIHFALIPQYLSKKLTDAMYVATDMTTLALLDVNFCSTTIQEEFATAAQ